MTMRPGFPEAGTFADMLAALDRRLSSLERSEQLILSSIGSGGLTVKDGGQIVFLDSSGDPLVTIDQNGALVTGSPVALNAQGLQVGADVVVDDTGLQVIGGYVTPLWVARYGDTASNVSLTTSYQVVNEIEIEPPDWVETVYLDIHGYDQISENVAQKNLETRWNINGGATFGGTIFTVGNNTTNSSGRRGTAAVTDLPITVQHEAHVNSGTNAVNEFVFSIIAFGIRNA